MVIVFESLGPRHRLSHIAVRRREDHKLCQGTHPPVSDVIGFCAVLIVYMYMYLVYVSCMYIDSLSTMLLALCPRESLHYLFSIELGNTCSPCSMCRNT